jgi:SNF2 family DNA or RNA helicase
MIEWVKDFLEGTTEQLVVFATHVFALRELEKAFPKDVKLIIGELSTGERTRHLTEFQGSKFRVLALSYQCGSESLNLQNASKALYLGYPWTDGKLKQAMARIYRQGQKNATMHYFLTSGECDQRILRLVRTKEEATNTVENLLLGQANQPQKAQVNFSIDDLI